MLSNSPQPVEQAKQMFWAFITGIISIFTPIWPILLLLSFAFTFNIIIGIRADKKVNKTSFKIGKAFEALSQLMFFFACVVFLSHGAQLLGEPSYGKVGVKWLTCIVIYFYFTNIFKNARLIHPKSEAISFIYDLLSTEIFDRLKKMIGVDTKSNNEE